MIEAQAIEVASGSVSLPVYRARLDGLECFVRPRAALVCLGRLPRTNRAAGGSFEFAREFGQSPPSVELDPGG